MNKKLLLVFAVVQAIGLIYLIACLDLGQCRDLKFPLWLIMPGFAVAFLSMWYCTICISRVVMSGIIVAVNFCTWFLIATLIKLVWTRIALSRRKSPN